MKTQTTVVCLLAMMIMACAGIGIPDSSDPYKKIQYSYYAMDQGRYIPADRLILGSIEIFKQRDDKAGLAEAYVTYGNYHKFSFNKGKLTKAPNLRESEKYFLKAIELYTELGNKNGIAKCHMGLGDALNDIDKKSSCQHYDLAIQYYDENGEKFYINPHFKNFPEMVKAFKKEYCIGIE